MNITEFEGLLSTIKDKLASKKEMLPEKDEHTWDCRAREAFYYLMRDVFQERFGMDEKQFRKYIFVEKFNPLPGEKAGKIFDSRLYPDATFKDDDGRKLAIELDHGKMGSKIKNALVKAGILKLVGDFYGIVVFFFIYPPGRTFTFKETEQKVLRFYKENLCTQVLLV
jgi:hypothetical protein